MTDDLLLRDCECSHREHLGHCRASLVLYAAPTAKELQPTWKPIPTHRRAIEAGLQAYSAPCPCDHFIEDDGEQP